MPSGSSIRDTPLAWLARMRQIPVHDHRVAAAMADLKENEKALPNHDARGRILHAWRTRRYGPADDLAEAERAMLSELGHRHERFRALLAIAREHFSRDDLDEGEAAILRALAEARRGGPGVLDLALQQAAPLWAAR